MAGVDIQSGSGKRPANADINMIPFIDLLMVTVAFLLITAVWVTNSQINANAEVPGPPSSTPVDPSNVERVLHVDVSDAAFKLTWKQAAVVVSESKVDRTGGPGDFDALEQQIAMEWKLNGSHRDPADAVQDRAVLHTDNRLPFKEITSVLDAIHGTKRPLRIGGAEQQVAAFNPTFSAH